MKERNVAAKRGRSGWHVIREKHRPAVCYTTHGRFEEKIMQVVVATPAATQQLPSANRRGVRQEKTKD